MTPRMRTASPVLPATRPVYAACLAALVLLQVACSSTPLPPWPTSADTTAPARIAPTSPPAPSKPAAAPPAAVASPVNPPQAVALSDTGADATESPAVAARFPAPPLAYSTPGLQSGRSNFTTNPEIIDWLNELAAHPSPGVKATVLSMGQSQQGSPLVALLLTRASSPDAPTVLATGRPTVLLVGQQHGNEPAGSEALLVVARELSQGLLEPMLDKINVIVVPRANPDGAAANQRATANGIDMNRDHLLLNTPEARALAQLERNYQPMVVVDAHEYTVAGRYLQKFGGVQKYDALLQYAMTANLPEFLTRASEEWFRRPLLAALKNQKLSSEWYYTTSNTADDLLVSMGGTQPDTGRNVNGLKNTVSMLVETRGVGIGRQHIQRRVHTQVTAMVSMLQSTASRSDELNQLRPYMERDVASQACRGKAVVEAGPTSAQYTLTLLDPNTGADRKVTVDWNSALELQNTKTRSRPCGYWLSANSTLAVDRLQMLGVQVMRVMEPGSLLGEAYLESSRSEGSRQDVRGAIQDGAPIVQTKVTLVPGVVDAPQNSFYVPLSQPMGNLVLAAMEPDTQNSYFANHLLDGLRDLSRVTAEPTVRMEKLP